MKTNWDYTEHARFYSSRPNYAELVIDQLTALVGARANDSSYLVADVGAGTGNLTVMLLARNLHVMAVEPNDEMRRFGTERTPGVRWIEGTGEKTGLGEATVDWVTMGSSFNTMDRPAALREVALILKPRGWFTCMWNHRNLADTLQNEVEELITRYVPGYQRGTRREDQTAVIEESGLFESVHFVEGDQIFKQPADKYVDAWRSTANLKTQAGERFDEVIEAIDSRVQPVGVLELHYTTRTWTARLKER